MLSDLRVALRSLRKRPWFALPAVGLLALGIGPVVTLFSITYTVVFEPLPYKDPTQLVDISSTLLRAGGFPTYVSEPDYLSIRDKIPAVENCAFYRSSIMAFRSPAGEKAVSVTLATGNLFSVLGARPLLGAGLPPAALNPAAVLSYTFWKASDLGGSPLGRSISLNGKLFTVVGVMPPHFDFPLGTQVWLPLPETPQSFRRDARTGRVLARLRRGIPVEALQRQLKALADRLAGEFPETNRGFGFLAVGLAESMLNRSSRSLLFLLLGASGCVLLIACADVAALLLGRATERIQEIAVRQALGAPRSRLIGSLSMESLVIATCGGTVGLGVAGLGVRVVKLTSLANLPRIGNAQINLAMLVCAMTVSLASVLIFGLLPVVLASRLEPTAVLQGEGGSRSIRLAVRPRTGKALLLAGEASVALILLAGAALTLRSLQLLVGIDPGYRSDDVLTFDLMLPDSRYPTSADQALFFQRLLSRLREVPGVDAAGASNAFTIGQETTRFSLPGRSAASALDLPAANLQIVTPEFFRTLGIRILAGREFTDTDTPSVEAVAIVNEVLARQFWKNDSPVGHYIITATNGKGAGKPLKIVGVVSNTRDVSLALAPQPEIYVPFAQNPVGGAAIFVHTTVAPSSLAAVVLTEIHALDPELPADSIMTLRQFLSQSLAPPRTIALLLGSFAALALLLATGGIYGVVSHSAIQRTHEIGIRMALGASKADILSMLLWENLRLILAGIATGSLGAFVLTRSLKSFLYGVRAADPWVLVVAALVLLSAALLACVVAGRRSTKVDPAVALRHL
jgi:putative ABC transport system permease protein